MEQLLIIEGFPITLQRDKSVKKTLSFVAVGLFAFMAQAAEIKVTVGADGESVKEYVITASNKPYLIDQRVAKKYKSHIGCKNFDTSKLTSEVSVGRVIEVTQEGVSADGTWISVKSSNTEFTGTTHFKVNADCTVINYLANTRSAQSHVFLKRGDPVSIDPGLILVLK